MWIIMFVFLWSTALLFGENAPPPVDLVRSADHIEVERLIASAIRLPVPRRIEFISKYLLGRKYHPETRERIKKQHTAAAVAKVEATNPEPMPVKQLRTGFKYLDCMTYVEHVLALAACNKASYEPEFLCRLIDIVYNADGKPLMNHYRNHFTSSWGDVNERKGYLVNVARNDPHALMRELYLNKVGSNRTFYVEDRFMIAEQPQQMWYFPLPPVLERKVNLASGDVVALVTDKEGLDVTHMGFFIEHSRKRWLRHASIKLNRIVDQDFDQYLRDGKQIKGLMVFRPLLQAKGLPIYRFRRVSAK